MLHNLKISSKLLISFILLFFVSIFLSYISLQGIYHIKNAYDELVNYSYPRIVLLSEMKNIATTLELSVLKKEITEENKNSVLQALGELDLIETKYQPYLKKNHPILPLDIISNLKDELTQIANQIVNLKNQALSEKAKEEHQKFYLILNNLEKLITNTLTEEIDLREFLKTEAIDTNSRLINAIIISTLAVILFFIILSTYLWKVIAKPLKELCNIAHDISDGNINRKIPINSHDEIGELSVSLNEMIQKLIQAKLTTNDLTDKLDEKEAKNHAILKTAADSIMTVNELGSVETCNEATEKLFGYNNKEMIGKGLDKLFKASSENNFYGNSFLLLSELTGLKQNPKELLGRRRDGSNISLEVRASRLSFKNKNSFIIITSDVTEKKKTELKMMEALQQANIANNAKKLFLMMMSHELRTPLNAIIGFTQCLIMEIDGPISEKQKVSLNTVNNSALQLLSEINTVLEFAMIETNMVELTYANANLIQIIEESISEAQYQAKKKMISIKLNLENSKSSLNLNLDKKLIRQAFFQVLINMIKYTNKGDVFIDVHSKNKGAEIVLSDPSLNIDEEHLLRLFRPRSNDHSTLQSTEGLGLGLFICQKIVQLHGGEMNLQKHKDKGFCFHIFLPN